MRSLSLSHSHSLPFQAITKALNALPLSLTHSHSLPFQAITKALNALPGVHCAQAGSLYAFPRVRLPPLAVQAATRKGLVPDVFYCLELLDATGLPFFALLFLSIFLLSLFAASS